MADKETKKAKPSPEYTPAIPQVTMLRNGGRLTGKSPVKLAKGGIVDSNNNAVDPAVLAKRISDMRKSGEISDKEARNLEKGLDMVKNASGQGVEYRITGNDTFTAKKNGSDIGGRASGLDQSGNILTRNLEGRKVSKLLALVRNSTPQAAAAAATSKTETAAPNPATPEQKAKDATAADLNPDSAKANASKANAAKVDNPSLNDVASPNKTPAKGVAASAKGTRKTGVKAPAKTAPANNAVAAKKPVTTAPAATAAVATPAKKTAIVIPAKSPAIPAKPETQKAPESPVTVSTPKSLAPSKISPLSFAKPAFTPPSVTITREASPLQKKTEAAKLQELTKTRQEQERKKILASKFPERAAEQKRFAEEHAKKIQAETQIKHLEQLRRQDMAVDKKIEQQKKQSIVVKAKKDDSLKVVSYGNWKKSLAKSEAEAVFLGKKKAEEKWAAMKLSKERMRLEDQKRIAKLQAQSNSFTKRDLEDFDKDPNLVSQETRAKINESYRKSQLEGIAKKAAKVQKKSIGGDIYSNAKKFAPYITASAAASSATGSSAQDKIALMRQEKLNLDRMRQEKQEMGAGLREGRGIRAANAALGIAGAISYATAKRPTLQGPKKFESNILPVQGMTEASKRYAENLIASNTLAASQPRSSDARINQSSQLEANRNANEALSKIAIQDAEMFNQDRIRANSQQNNDMSINFQNDLDYGQRKFDLANEEFAARRAAGQNMMQSAANYEVQRAAGITDKRIAENTANRQMGALGETSILTANADLRIAGKPAMSQEEQDATRLRFTNQQTNNYQRPRRISGRKYGGRIGKNMMPC